VVNLLTSTSNSHFSIAFLSLPGKLSTQASEETEEEVGVSANLCRIVMIKIFKIKI
jgi:hypothetical protein